MPAPLTATHPAIEAKIVSAVASGLTYRQVAKGLGISKSTVDRVMKVEANRKLLASLRDEIRARTLEGIKETSPKALQWLDDIVTSRTSARDADAIARAVHALEKTAASASGEQRQAGEKTEIVVRFADWSPVQLGQAQGVEATRDEPRALPESTPDPP